MSSFLVNSLATTDALAELFSDRALLAAMLRVEAALARAEADAGLIRKPSPEVRESPEPYRFPLSKP